MNKFSLGLMIAVLPILANAGERVVVTNSYVRDIESWPVKDGTFWRQNHFGTFKVKEGPITDGLVNCIGSGFGGASGVRGEGICIYELTDGTFTMTWQSIPGAPNNWQIGLGTGRYEGIEGKGTSVSKVKSEFTAIQHYESTWSGEITLKAD